jgi:predicted regulator of Ras-like GTPase activity (Roadblock/LC7/MglB family)
MSFDKLLEKLVESVYGARGAVFLDGDGEVVQCYVPHKGMKELDLIGAYHGITLTTCRKFSDEVDMGTIQVMICQYKDATCIIKTLNEGYFVLLALGPQGNIGQAIYSLHDIATSLNEEMGL